VTGGPATGALVPALVVAIALLLVGGLVGGPVGGSVAVSRGASQSPASPATATICDAALGANATPEARPTTQPPVLVAAASDLRYVMEDLVAAYEAAEPDGSVEVTYGSSGNFFAQISQGAPFDVYFSADIEYPRALEEAGLAEPGSTRLYAEGRLVTWVREDSPIDIETQGLAAVLDPSAERVAIANPEHAPYGRAARAAMEASGLWEAAQPRVVLGESISQAAQFAESGAADIGVLALSLAIAPPLCHQGRYVLVPARLHPPILQGALVLDDAAHPDAADAFLDFVLGPVGREVLDRYGLLLPEP
jgi:molybdate transport system substrate-binding protein